MVKEYGTLKQAGYTVKVLYSFWEEWASRADEKMFDSGEIERKDFVLIGGSPFRQKWTYTVSRTRKKIMQFLYSKSIVKNELLSRTTYYLIAAAKRERADLYIAHNAGALPAAIAGAVHFQTKAGFDAEDFHRGEYQDQQSRQCKHLIAVENKYLPQCNYATAASPLIAAAYQRLYPALHFVTINNVFSRTFLQSQLQNNDSTTLTLFWFSQTIGPNRGLETIVKALNLVDESCKTALYLMGNISKGFDTVLLSLSARKNIQFLPPVSPAEIFAIASKYHIGLSVEVPDFVNRDLCLTNKIFTYLLAGNCILFSDTAAQIAFLNSYPDTGFHFEAGNEKQLAGLIQDLYYNREKLTAARQAALQLADRDMNWEIESIKFKQLIKEVLSS